MTLTSVFIILAAYFALGAVTWGILVAIVVRNRNLADDLRTFFAMGIAYALQRMAFAWLVWPVIPAMLIFALVSSLIDTIRYALRRRGLK